MGGSNSKQEQQLAKAEKDGYDFGKKLKEFQNN